MIEKQDAILLCEDDVSFGMLLKDYLTQNGYIVDLTTDGEKGWQKFCETYYDLCIFDVMMPVRNGFELAKAIRMTGSQVPIIFLSARSAVEDILEGYKSGCHDYVTKPCSMAILMCKIECLIKFSRTQKIGSNNIYILGVYTYNATEQTLSIGETKQHLSSRENELLHIFVQNKNQLVERKMLLTSVWRNDNYFTGRSLSVYINHLRGLLKEDDSIKLINVHGKGYKFVIPD